MNFDNFFFYFYTTISKAIKKKSKISIANIKVKNFSFFFIFLQFFHLSFFNNIKKKKENCTIRLLPFQLALAEEH